MTDYAIDVMKQPSHGYDVLVALPLAFVTLFCFVLVMMHPYYKPQAATATAIVAGSKAHSLPSAVTVDITGPLSPLSTVATPSVSSTASTSLSASSNTQALSNSLSTTSTTGIKQSSSLSASSIQAAVTNSSSISTKTSGKSIAPPKKSINFSVPSLQSLGL